MDTRHHSQQHIAQKANQTRAALAVRTQVQAGYITCSRSAEVLAQDCRDKYSGGSSDLYFCISKIDDWAQRGCPYPAPDR